MISVKIFNQRDPRWASIQHGTSSSTIGQTGCTICVVCSILWHAGYKTITPKELNSALKNNNGYSQGNLIIWTKVAELYPKVKWVYRYYAYNNTKASEWINRGMLPCIQVGAAPIGGSPNGTHWIGFIGNKMSIDPWNGNTVNTSTWEPKGMALYEYTPVESSIEEGEESMMYGSPNQYDLSNQESMKVAVDELNKVISGYYVKKEEAERLLNEAVSKVNEQKGSEINSLSSQLNVLTTNQMGIAALLGLDKNAQIDAILEAITTLKNKEPVAILPTNYNGKEVLGIILKP